MIYDLLEELRILNTEQLAILCFEKRLKVTQRRLNKLYKKKKLSIEIIAANQPYCYSLPDQKQFKQIEHIIMTNWVYIWYKIKLGGYERIFHYSNEKQNEIVRYDGFLAIDNDFTGMKFYFIETDLSNNNFDKVKKYNKYYDDKIWMNEWWLKYAKGFPSIIILTHREKLVSDKIKNENVNGLEFIVYGMDFIDKMRKLIK